MKARRNLDNLRNEPVINDILEMHLLSMELHYLTNETSKRTHEYRSSRRRGNLLGRLHRRTSPECCCSQLQGNKAERRTRLDLPCMFGLTTCKTQVDFMCKHTSCQVQILQIQEHKASVSHAMQISATTSNAC